MVLQMSVSSAQQTDRRILVGDVVRITPASEQIHGIANLMVKTDIPTVSIVAHRHVHEQVVLESRRVGQRNRRQDSLGYWGDAARGNNVVRKEYSVGGR